MGYDTGPGRQPWLSPARTSVLVLVGVVVAVTAVVATSAVYLLTRPEQEPPFFGVEVPRGDPGAAVALGQEVGCAPSVLSRFVKLDSTFTDATMRSLTQQGRTAMLTVEPWSHRMRGGDVDAPQYSLASLVRGEHDAELWRIGEVIATHGQPVLVRFAHEMNGDWYPWGVGVNGNSPDQYVAAWRHVHDLLDRAAPNISWVWAPAATWWDDPLPLRHVFPGDQYVDYVAVSGYRREGGGATPEETYGSWHEEVRRLTDRPAILSEIGASGPGKQEWIEGLPEFLDARPDIEGFVWFNTSPATTGATGDYRIDTDADLLGTFRRALSEIGVPCAQETAR